MRFNIPILRKMRRINGRFAADFFNLSPMRHFYLLIVLYLLLPAGARAQGLQTISGTVQTEAGMPLPGATVFLKGTYTGGSTNEEGQFQLKGDFARGPLQRHGILCGHFLE